MIVKSLDHSMQITKDDNVQEKFNELMSAFLSKLPSRINAIPCTIHLDIEKGDDWWNFVANIESAYRMKHIGEPLELHPQLLQIIQKSLSNERL